MKKAYRLFVVSDIHGHCTLLKKALAEAGFDENDPSHLFVCCGDLFDRGPENRKVYDYVRRLKHKILIRGNHDQRLVELLESRQVGLHDEKNGTLKTVREFFGENAVDASGEIRLPKHGHLADNLCRWIRGMKNYWETDRYVFTHGWLPLQPNSNISTVRPDWRTVGEDVWRYARWLQWPLLYNAPSRIPGKTIVCGHRHTTMAHFLDPQRRPEDPGIFYGYGMIAIDAGTVLSGTVNVLVLEEEIEADDL